MIRLWQYVRGVVGGWVRSITVDDDTDAALTITQNGSAEGIDSKGRIKATAVAAADDVIVAKEAASHTGDLFQGQASGGSALFKIEKDGDINSLSAGGHKVNFSFFQTNVAANQTAVTIEILGMVGSTVRPVSYAGSILAVLIVTNEARTAGTASVEVFINDVATGLTATLDAGHVAWAYTTQAKDTDAFAAGGWITVKITTSADWAPVTADIVVTVVVEM